MMLHKYKQRSLKAGLAVVNMKMKIAEIKDDKRRLNALKQIEDIEQAIEDNHSLIAMFEHNLEKYFELLKKYKDLDDFNK